MVDSLRWLAIEARRVAMLVFSSVAEKRDLEFVEGFEIGLKAAN